MHGEGSGPDDGSGEGLADQPLRDYGPGPGYGPGAGQGYGPGQGYAPGPGQGYAPQGPWPSQNPAGWRPTNQMAVASLACACAQIILPVVTAIPAIILGHVARRQIRQTGENGAGLALAGLVIGYAGVILSIAGLIAVISLIAHFSSQTNFGVCPNPGSLSC
jgi:hypothetical protein